jgi:hypothetical protein
MMPSTMVPCSHMPMYDTTGPRMTPYPWGVPWLM